MCCVDMELPLGIRSYMSEIIVRDIIEGKRIKNSEGKVCMWMGVKVGIEFYEIKKVGEIRMRRLI